MLRGGSLMWIKHQQSKASVASALASRYSSQTCRHMCRCTAKGAPHEANRHTFPTWSVNTSVNDQKGWCKPDQASNILHYRRSDVSLLFHYCSHSGNSHFEFQCALMYRTLSLNFSTTHRRIKLPRTVAKTNLAGSKFWGSPTTGFGSRSSYGIHSPLAMP